MRAYNQGEIVEIVFPFDEGTGSKQRPAIVLADEGDTLIAVKVTSQHKGRKWDIELPKDVGNGLAFDSVIQVDTVRKLSKKALCSVIPRGNVNSLQMSLILERIKEYRESLRE